MQWRRTALTIEKTRLAFRSRGRDTLSMPIASQTEPAASAEPGAGVYPSAGHSTGASAAGACVPEALERRTREIGRELFERMGGRPKPWQRAWWEERFIGATLDDPLVRVQLFRFIDALPALKTAESIRRHLAEYLEEAGDRVPWWLRLGLALAPADSVRADWLARIAEFSAGAMAQKFIAGATPGEAIQTVLALRRRMRAFTADILGEAVISEAEAEHYQETCLASTGRARRADRLRIRDRSHRPRSAWSDSARQSFAQAVESDGPLRGDSRRGDDRPRWRAAAAHLAQGP